ncbi:MAG: S-layer homology domain-containing protein [Oscillospiraceae bacterium]|nr:S-layer homology domain-containing protein [Oscillospiraceae bacterium]
MKRIVSLLIAVAMLISLMPTIALSAEADGSFVVDFRTGDVSTMNSETRYPTYTENTKGEGWSVDGANSTLANGSTMSYFDTYTSIATWSATGNEYVTFDFTVPGDGTYEVTAFGMHRVAGGYINYFIDSEFIGKFDCYAAKDNLTTATSETLGTITLTAGTHKLKLLAEKSSGANAMMLPVKVEFQKKVIKDNFSVDLRTGDTSTMTPTEGWSSTNPAPGTTRYPNYLATSRGEGWSVDGANSTIADGSTGSCFEAYSSFATWGVADNKYITFDFETYGGGIYDITAYGMHRPEGGYINYFIDGIYVGRFDCRADKADYVNATSAKLRPMKLSDGKHKLTFLASSSGGAHSVMLPVEVKFEKKEELTKIDEAVLLYDKTELLTGENANLSGVLKFENGAEIDLRREKLNLGNATFAGGNDESIKLIVKSSDDSVISVSESGAVTAVGAGKADVSLSVEVDGNIKELEPISFTVIKEKIEEVLLSSEKAFVLMADADGMKINVSAKYNTGRDVDISKAEISFESSDENVATVDAGGIVKPVSVGEVEISASVTIDGESASGKISLVVSEEPVYPSFKVDFQNQVVPTVYDATIENTGWQINKSMTDSKLCDGSTITRFQVYGLQIQSSNAEASNQISFDFYMKDSGAYDITFRGIQASGGASAAYIYIDGKYIGQYDFYSPATVNPAYIANLRSLELSEGTHTLTLVAKEKTGWGANMYPSYLEFKGTGELSKTAELGAEMARKNIAAGESEEYALYVLQDNGTKYYARPSLDGIKEINLAMTSSDASVAVVDGAFVKAKTPGNVKMLISGKIGDAEVSDEFDFVVNDSVFDKATIDLIHEIFYVGGETEISAGAILSDGIAVNTRDISYYFTSDNEAIAEISGNKLLTLAEGEANITAHVTFNGTEKTVTERITVESVKLASISARCEDKIVSVLDFDGSKLMVTGTNNDGSEGNLDGAIYSYESLTPDIVAVNDEGSVFSVARGTGVVRVTADVGGIEFTYDATVVSSSEKTEPTLYTYEMREMALRNVGKYDWARTQAKNAAVAADKWVENLDVLYSNLPGEGVPRSATIATLNAPDTMMYNCPYCKTDIRAKYGSYGWNINVTRNPWKVQCPDCKRLFPSNDFELLYKRGLDENGVYNRELAIENNRIAVENGEKDALVNVLYPDVWKDEQLDVSAENASTWMVDDGYGWSVSDGTYGTKTLHKFCPVALYMHGAWYDLLQGDSFITAVDDLKNAYLYTGDKKYGRAGAILIDRIADLYPYFKFENTSLSYSNSHGGRNSGRILGSIWQNGLSQSLVTGYDAFYPIYDDAQVVTYLSKKALENGLENPKTSPDMIRENIENGILRESVKDLKEGRALGNFGMHQLLAAQVAIVLDCSEETNAVFDWIIATGTTKSKSMKDSIYGETYNVCISNSGGEMVTRYINEVDRDGFGNEVGASYNNSWLSGSFDVAEAIYRYGVDNENLDLFANPKFVKMIRGMIELTLGNDYTYAGGDYGETAGKKYATNTSILLRAYNLLRDPRIAQNYYYISGNKIEDPIVDIFTNNDTLEAEMKQVIEENGERIMESNNLTGFGLAILRGGKNIKSSSANSDEEQRYDTYMYYGRTSGHGHRDMLQLGIDAYGFNFTPDLGYPEETGTQPNRLQWVSNTLSHNTVVVNEDWQNSIYTGYPMHFDSTEKVKLVDVKASPYDETEIYRRTALTIEASPKDVYTIDFFRVKGGDEHTYSFHTQSYMGYTTDDLNLVAQVDENGEYVGSYAGKDVPYGKDPNSPNAWTYETEYPRGYTWLDNVNRAENIEDGTFSVNFEQTDFKKQVNDSKDLNLKFTALNDWTPDGVGIATGYAPNVENNKAIPGLDYMLIHRKGTELDTLFTSLIQPYKGEMYIESAESISVSIKDGKAAKDDVVKAVKVKLKSGRCDYVVYATNNGITYTVTDGNVSFDFRGFVGVYSVNEAEENIYAYVNDGDIIGENQGVAAYKGTVIDFTEELSFDNSINVKFDGDVDLSELEDKYIYVENSGSQNGAYKIVGAEQNGENVSLNIGDISLISAFKNTADFSQGYVYNIQKGQSFTIPLSNVYNEAPRFAPVSDKITTSAGSSITIKLNAESPLGENITFAGIVMPRGASIDESTGVITWKPTSSQLGESGFLITARDESGRESSQSFDVTVYGSTGGGGGGGESATTTTPNKSEASDEPETPDTPKVPDTPEISDVRFIDLGNHAWAEDAINALADEGIIKGTSGTTFSPGNNITRADFAILLVRAFGLSSDNTENFADVLETDYFARELAIARNTGLVGGIGDNKYAPRENITRQDMMVIVYRALAAFEKIEKRNDTQVVPYEDFDSVSDYAKEAVSALISAGLVNGKNGEIAPTDYTTRAEVAVLIKRILDYTK